MDLTQKKCVPCEGGIPKLSPEEADQLLQNIPDWERHGDKLFKIFRFKKFMDSIEFVNKIILL